MRRAGFALTIVLAAASVSLAQTPGQPGDRIPIPGAEPPAGPAPLDPKLVNHLNAWEAVMKNAANFYTECTRVRKNTLHKVEKTATGSLMCQKPNLARMRLETRPSPGQKPDPNDYEAYICTGATVYEYVGLAKTVTAYQLQNAGVGDNLLLEFMSGTLKANDVIRRFDLKLIQQDANYIYIELGAKLPKDRAEFEKMILVLHQPNIPNNGHLAYLPRTVVMRKNTGQEEETWDFPSPRINVQIAPASFQYVPPPQDWKVQKAQVGGAPPGPPGGAGLPVARPKGP